MPGDAKATPADAKATPGDAKALLREALVAVGNGRLDQARVLLDRARALVGTDRKLELRAIHVAIAVYTNQGDYEAAARALLDAIRRRHGDPADADLFYLHNQLVIVREAEGDLPGAILECAERTAVGYEGTWEPAAERLQQTRFKDDWHRAYLFRMYAEQLSGTRRDAALLAAEQARKDYVAAGGYADSTAVLDALFAMYDHRWDDVRAAVRRVDLAKDDDEEDLYLLFSALDATGDHDAAAAIRRRIEQNPPSWGVWRAWLKSDSDGAPAAMKRFSPRYPTGKRP
jgi:tetratricopeptide (TPR) repeat protein